MNRLILVALVLTSTAPAPVMARKWTSRSGGFSIEADLIDVREGQAVLKKNDGSEVNVPLSKLSLADIRYIDGVIKSAEAGLGGKPEGQVAPPANASQFAERKVEPATEKAGATSAQGLRYGWKKGQTFHYRVKTEVQLSTEAEILEGTVRYSVKSVNSEGVAEIEYHENVTRGQRPVAVSAPRYAPSRSRLPPSRYSPGRYYYSAKLFCVWPLTAFDFGQSYAEFSQSLPRRFGVALARLGVPLLVPSDLLGGLREDRFSSASVKPPGPHHRTHGNVDLAHCQFRIFFPATLLAFEPETTG
ncbi:MAG: SHD1 domain-containing protein [Planctomycetota bacterium]|nr:SHD1 domain-containing protein [Planctomycetota bacterium]